MKEKVILANTHSFSSFLPDFRVKEEINELPYGGGWHVRLAQQIAKYTDRYDLGVLEHRKAVEQEFVTQDDDILYRFFPAQYIGSKRINLGEVSWPLLRELRRSKKTEFACAPTRGICLDNCFCIFLHQKNSDSGPMLRREIAPAALFGNSGKEKYLRLGEYLLRGFFFERALKERVDCFLVLNKPTERYFSRLVGAEKVQVSPMGIDFSVYRKIDKNRARDDLGLDSSKKYVLCVAAMVKRKGWAI